MRMNPTTPSPKRSLMKKRPNEKVLAPVRPNAGLSAAYERRLYLLVDAMQKSIIYWLTAAYHAKPPENLASDAKYWGSPAMVMRRTMKRLTKLWQKKFDEAAPELADYFSKAFVDRSDKALAATLRKAGISVQFKMTPAANDVVQAEIGANVSLITNIAEKHLASVEGAVLRSISAGRDVGTLTKELGEQLGITKRRAALIAHHQNNLATAAIQRTRYKELGIKEAIWCHSAGGKQPRHSHLEAGKEKLRYDPQVGAYIDGEYILPGELINCRCFSKPVIAGFD